MNYATVSHGQAIFRCVYDSELGFMCGKCRGLLGFRPDPGDVCKCGARVEEAMYDSKRAAVNSDVRQAPAGHVANPAGALRRFSNAEKNR